MTDNELNELIKIRDNAPVCSTHIETLASSNIYYLKRFNQYGVFGYKFWSTDHDCWVDSGDCTGNIRSLSDINTIIQLEQQKRELVKSSDWINVRDELPEKNSEGHALIYRPESYEKQGCKTQIVPMRMVSKMVDATHWMVAPTPQKDLTND